MLRTHLRDTHLICGQSTRLVRTYYVRATQSFNTRKIPDNGILLGHFLGTKCQTCSNNSGQSFWDSGNRKGYCNLEVINRAFQGSVVGWIPEVTEVYEPNKDTDDGNDLGEHVTKIIKFPFERRFFANLRRDGFVYMADGCLLPSENDHGFRPAVNDCCALHSIYIRFLLGALGRKPYREEHIGHVLFHGFRVGDSFYRLVHANTFTSQDRLVYPEATRGDGE